MSWLGFVGCTFTAGNANPKCVGQEIHTLKTQLEAAKYDVIKYCIGKHSCTPQLALRSRACPSYRNVSDLCGAYLPDPADRAFPFYLTFLKRFRVSIAGSIVSVTAVGLGLLRIIM